MIAVYKFDEFISSIGNAQQEVGEMRDNCKLHEGYFILSSHQTHKPL